MAWDLRKALLRKGEVESARLDDFAFRERARTMRLLAEMLGEALGEAIDPAALVTRIVEEDDAEILAALIAEHPGLDADGVQAAYERCRMTARATLIAEIGDPTPHRLA